MSTSIHCGQGTHLKVDREQRRTKTQGWSENIGKHLSDCFDICWYIYMCRHIIILLYIYYFILCILYDIQKSWNQIISSDCPDPLKLTPTGPRSSKPILTRNQLTMYCEYVLLCSSMFYWSVERLYIMVWNRLLNTVYSCLFNNIVSV